MSHELNDSSVLDTHEFTSLNCEGDVHDVLIVLCYDLDCDCYTVEKFINSKSRDVETFDDSAQASAFFTRYVRDVEADYTIERAEFARSLSAD